MPLFQRRESSCVLRGGSVVDEYYGKDYTAASWVERLPRVHAGLSAGVFSDPYANTGAAVVREAIDRIGEGDLLSPGSMTYSNLGYAVLGMVLEEVTGQSWIEVVTDAGSCLIVQPQSELVVATHTLVRLPGPPTASRPGWWSTRRTHRPPEARGQRLGERSPLGGPGRRDPLGDRRHTPQGPHWPPR